MRRFNVVAICCGWLVLTVAPPGGGAEPAVRSHPPLRRAPAPLRRPLAEGPAYFVDAGKGNDADDGSEPKPWRTVGHAVRRLRAGDTLYLRGGVYHENVYLALVGRADAPITIRGYPGEEAILDGGLAEFAQSPAEAWEPAPGGATGEFRSRRTYPNLREVLGSFGDSHVGLQTYYHAEDFRCDREQVDWIDWENPGRSDIKPLWCGPGLWYDRATGHIHVRLAHTHLPDLVPNYTGETDPRKLPLLLAPFHSTVLHLDQAKHVRVQDLTLQGAGYASVVLDQAGDIELDNLTVWCGTYGIRASGTQRLKLLRSGLYGNVAPWTFRGDGSKRDYPDRPHRNISRLNTHALLEIDSGRESSVYATPQNDHWEIAYCEFTDAHDGPYLGGINVRFHHNRIEGLQDDGLYLSPMYHRHRLDPRDPEIHIYENVFGAMLTALAFGGSETTTRDRVFVYRNVFDLRALVQTGRPTARKENPGLTPGKVIGDHGSPPWPTMFLYQNTFVMRGARTADMGTLGAVKPGYSRRVFNNIFLHEDRLPGFAGAPAGSDAVSDGNLYAASAGKSPTAAQLFQRFRASPGFRESQTRHAPGSTTNSLVADPKLMNLQIQEGSPAVDAGVTLPADWPDPLRETGKPDLGAVPLGGTPLEVGRRARREP